MKKALWFGGASALPVACSGAGDPVGDDVEPQDTVGEALVASTAGAEDSYVTTYNDVPRGSAGDLRVGAGSLKQQTLTRRAGGRAAVCHTRTVEKVDLDR